MKRNLIGLLVLSVVGSFLWYILSVHPLTNPGTPPETATSTIPAATSYTEHAKYYDITAFYATSTPLTGGANSAAVALMQQFISDTIAQFKSDGNFDHLTQQDIHMMGFDQGRKESLQIKYLIGSSKQTVSYIYTIYEDTGGAHGNTVFRTFTFDTKTGASLALADAFSPGAPYLQKLSTLSRQMLPAIIDPQLVDTTFLTDGTKPQDASFQNFFFDNSDFVILFAPYQIAAYAAGPITLRIPASQLKSIFKPQYP